MLKKLSLAHWWQLKSCRNRFLSLQLLVLDVDGVLTDGGLWYGADGELAKRLDVRDGHGIRFLQHVGVKVTLLSGGGGGRERETQVVHE
jgi:3-deoxy-D-manno-octulosonate 8-phosphate phosphatase (KDO 8-P phosphatase)